MTQNRRKDRKWMQNPNQLKNPKVFNVKMLRKPDGSFHIIGGQTMVLERKNQYSNQWVNVDTRDFASELRNSPIVSH